MHLTNKTDDRPWVVMPPLKGKPRRTMQCLTPAQQDELVYKFKAMEQAKEARLDRAALRVKQSKAEARERHNRMVERTGIGVYEPNIGGPTPQTKARLRPDVVLELFKRGRIGPAELSAYTEIRDTLEAITLPLRVKGMKYEPSMGKQGRRQPTDPGEHMGVEWRSDFRRIFQPWSIEMSNRLVTWQITRAVGVRGIWVCDLKSIRGTVRYLEIVHDVIVDGFSMTQAGRRLHCAAANRARTVERVISQALSRYVALRDAAS